MEHKGISLRPFIGARDYEVSRSFYRDLGFESAGIGKDIVGLTKSGNRGKQEQGGSKLEYLGRHMCGNYYGYDK